MIEEISRIVLESNVYKKENMAKHTSFRTGGEATYLVTPESVEALRGVIELCKKSNTRFYIIGNGTNILVPDNGIQGVVIKLGEKFSDIVVNEDECIVTACAGAMLSKIANTAYKYSYTGLEYAAGIPGSVGGAICMNAGAYGSEMKDVVTNVCVMDYDGNICSLSNEDMNFSYRHSLMMEKEYIVLSATMKLSHGNQETIKNTMKELADRRREKQPLEYASAGSTFKRPEGYYAGKLIQDAGLAGYHIRDAEVSTKHCGFIINKGNATTTDILELINYVQKRVLENSGVHLETEVRVLL